METFKIWILSLCGATAITSLCKIFLSKSKYRNITNVFLSMFVLLYTVLPFENIKFNIDYFKEGKSYEYSKISYYQEGYEFILKESINKICEKFNIGVISIEIDSYIDDDNYFIVENLVIDIKDDSRIAEVKDIIKNNLNYEVNVIWKKLKIILKGWTLTKRR